MDLYYLINDSVYQVLSTDENSFTIFDDVVTNGPVKLYNHLIMSNAVDSIQNKINRFIFIPVGSEILYNDKKYTVYSTYKNNNIKVKNSESDAINIITIPDPAGGNTGPESAGGDSAGVKVIDYKTYKLVNIKIKEYDLNNNILSTKKYEDIPFLDPGNIFDLIMPFFYNFIDNHNYKFKPGYKHLINIVRGEHGYPELSLCFDGGMRKLVLSVESQQQIGFLLP